MKIQSSWTWAPCDSEHLELFSMSTQRRLQVRISEPEELARILDQLDDWIAVDELAERSHSNKGMMPFVQKLVAAGVILARPKHEVEGDGRNADEFFDRQIRFLDMFETSAKSGLEMHERLRRAKVLLVGAGGWGTWTALLLARMGIGDLVVFDDDTVEASNLNRQILFGAADVGRRKVDVLAESIERETGGRCRTTPVAEAVRGTGDLEPHIDRDHVYLMNPFGYAYGFFVDLARMGVQLGLTTLSFGGNWIGPLTVPGVTPCLDCAMADPSIAEAVGRWGDAWRTPRRASGVVAARAASNCSFATWEIFELISGIREPQSASGMVMVDSFDYTRTTVRPMQRDECCSTCGKSSS